MDIQTSLYHAKLITLDSIDHEKDPAIESRWTHDPEYLRMLSGEPALPLSVAAMKKKYEKIEKEAGENKNQFYFQIRTNPSGGGQQARLIGFIQISGVEWNHGSGWVRIGIGDPVDRRKGYGSEAMRLILCYAFAELNLFRLSAMIPEYNLPGLKLFTKVGFIEEVCNRKALNRDGHIWNSIRLGILRDEWKEE
jgi:RimJ/RimL family protein N-acetyltransferase